MEDLTEKIGKLARPILEDSGYDLVDLDLHRQKQSVNILILADRHNGGITLTECSDLNKKVGDALEREDIISDHYLLEVSSPGMDRPIKTIRDFRRVINREIRVFLSEPIEGKLEYSGTMKSVDDESVTMVSDAENIIIPIGKINYGKQVV